MDFQKYAVQSIRMFFDNSFEPLLGLIDPVDLAGIAWVIIDDVYERKAIIFPL